MSSLLPGDVMGGLFSSLLIPGDGRFVVLRDDDQISSAPINRLFLPFEGEAGTATVRLVEVDRVLSVDRKTRNRQTDKAT